MSNEISKKADKRNDGISGISGINEKIIRKCRVLVGAVVVGALYFVWIKMTGIAIPCIVQKVTGWKCPGCGITTLFYCLFQFRIRDAFEANPFLFVTMPFLLYEIIREGILGPTKSKWNNVTLIVYLALLIVFGIVRNLSL